MIQTIVCMYLNNVLFYYYYSSLIYFNGYDLSACSQLLVFHVGSTSMP